MSNWLQSQFNDLMTFLFGTIVIIIPNISLGVILAAVQLVNYVSL